MKQISGIFKTPEIPALHIHDLAIYGVLNCFRGSSCRRLTRHLLPLRALRRRTKNKMLATCSQDNLLRMIQTIGVPTFAMDVLDDGSFHYVGINSRLEEITGLSTVLVQGRSPGEIMAQAHATAMEQRCRNCVRLRG